MLRGGSQVSAEDNSKQLQQKQKKRLSFRDPEVEGPQRNSLYAGCRSKTLTRPTKVTTFTRRGSSSVEDLTLEDQALQIAQNVGNAFSDLSTASDEQQDFLDTFSSNSRKERETEIIDYSPEDFEEDQRSCQLRHFKISPEDQEYLDDLVPPLLNTSMRGPSVEDDDSNPPKNCIPSEAMCEGRSSTNTQHQVQLLRYQLDQQNQQTQMALHQVQLLQDQVNAENVARRKAQEQNNQLMQQNKELLSHMEKLFQQIEDLENQIKLLEQEKKTKRTTSNQEKQVSLPRQPITFTGNRRLSTEQAIQEKPTIHSRNQYAAARRASLTSTKPLAASPKLTSSQSSSTINRKTSIVSPKPYTSQVKNTDHGGKTKETLRIGDTSPPVQSGTLSPFGSGWKLKTTEDSMQSSMERSGSIISRSRAGSFSSFVKKPQEGTSQKSTLFSSNSNLTSTSVTNKKHSSSTSDLYNSQGSFQAKSLMIEEPISNVKSSFSNLNLNTSSKLPRYQPYTGWQRRTSLTNDSEQLSAFSKDGYKNAPQTSLFNR